MMEKDFDINVIKSLISLYKEISEQIESLGESVVSEHLSSLIKRRETLKLYIVNYSQRYFKGLAYAEHMNMSEIEEFISNNKKK